MLTHWCRSSEIVQVDNVNVEAFCSISAGSCTGVRYAQLLQRPKDEAYLPVKITGQTIFGLADQWQLALKASFEILHCCQLRSLFSERRTHSMSRVLHNCKPVVIYESQFVFVLARHVYGQSRKYFRHLHTQMYPSHDIHMISFRLFKNKNYKYSQIFSFVDTCN